MPMLAYSCDCNSSAFRSAACVASRCSSSLRSGLLVAPPLFQQFALRHIHLLLDQYALPLAPLQQHDPRRHQHRGDHRQDAKLLQALLVLLLQALPDVEGVQLVENAGRRRRRRQRVA